MCTLRVWPQHPVLPSNPSQPQCIRLGRTSEFFWLLVSSGHLVQPLLVHSSEGSSQPIWGLLMSVGLFSFP